MADKVAVRHGDQIERGEKSVRLSHCVNEVVFHTARLVDVPERFAGERFYLAVIRGLLGPNGQIHKNPFFTRVARH